MAIHIQSGKIINNPNAKIADNSLSNDLIRLTELEVESDQNPASSDSYSSNNQNGIIKRKQGLMQRVFWNPLQRFQAHLSITYHSMRPNIDELQTNNNSTKANELFIQLASMTIIYPALIRGKQDYPFNELLRLHQELDRRGGHFPHTLKKSYIEKLKKLIYKNKPNKLSRDDRNDCEDYLKYLIYDCPDPLFREAAFDILVPSSMTTDDLIFLVDSSFLTISDIEMLQLLRICYQKEVRKIGFRLTESQFRRFREDKSATYTEICTVTALLRHANASQHEKELILAAVIRQHILNNASEQPSVNLIHLASTIFKLRNGMVSD